MNRPLFITATDTDAGKTWVSEQLCHFLQQRGHQPLALKPVVSGYRDDDANGDVQRLLRAQKRTDASAISYYRFQYPAAPSIAAAHERTEVSLNTLLDWCREQCRNHREAVLIEGVGGLMVPLNAQHTVLDWIQHLPSVRILLCAELKLGCISHTLLSVEALLRRGLTPDWVVLNERVPCVDPEHRDAMAAAIQSFLPPSIRLLRCAANQGTSLSAVVDSWSEKENGNA